MAQTLAMEDERPESINDMMGPVLNNLGGITNYLRRHEYNDTANRISKHAGIIAVEFTQAMRELMGKYPSENKANGSNGNVDANHSHKEKGKPLVDVSDPEEKSLLDLGYSKPAPLQGNLWSKIAAAAPPQAACQPIVLHDTGPPRKPKSSRIPLVPIFTVVPATARQTMAPPATVEGKAERAGVVIVEGKFTLGSLNMLTARICEGPLYSVDIHHHTGFAEIVFQHAAHAKEFLAKDKHAMENVGYGRFGNGFKVRHDKYKERPWDRDLKMSHEGRERRRLTFARTKLLARPHSFRVLEEELERMAGHDGIDFVWKFNTGNVTAVFKSVKTARLVRVRFLQRASRPDSQFAGVSIEYSSDPCEKQLTLTQNGMRPLAT
ncbi:hypothetical protein GX51_08225 [Blastomyces parvus]|uniref:RRM domain-containing protein n=1 Tax=Blastomyces parvus TaxID=2060905 RepID=A0A2B7W7N0_9EURO|nr:hypothetical protein GX51_08225 [Blastomyces parvus]